MDNGVTTYYPNQYYEKRVEGLTEQVDKYYFAGTSRIAMRENGTLTWLLTDHLGSTSVTADASGNLTSSLRYTAFGEVRAASGATSTDYRYTGQLEQVKLGAIGLINIFVPISILYKPTSRLDQPSDGLVTEPRFRCKAEQSTCRFQHDPLQTSPCSIPNGGVLAFR